MRVSVRTVSAASAFGSGRVEQVSGTKSRNAASCSSQPGAAVSDLVVKPSKTRTTPAQKKLCGASSKVLLKDVCNATRTGRRV